VRTTDKKGKVTVTRQKRSQDELNRIQELAEAAIGFDAKRGDTISVQNLSFDSGSTDGDLPAPNLASEVQKTVSDYSSLLRPLSLLGLFLLAYFLIIRPVQKHALRQGELTAGLQPALAAAHVQGLSAEPTEAIDVGRRAAQLKLQSSELAKQNPADTARTMQTWMHEERS
jgi:flagellar M-ring protein FliF